MSDPFAGLEPHSRETILHGEPVTIRYGENFTDVGVSSILLGPEIPMNAEMVSIVSRDGKRRGAELPREWREWTNAELIEKLPMCHLL